MTLTKTLEGCAFIGHPTFYGSYAASVADFLRALMVWGLHPCVVWLVVVEVKALNLGRAFLRGSKNQGF